MKKVSIGLLMVFWGGGFFAPAFAQDAEYVPEPDSQDAGSPPPPAPLPEPAPVPEPPPPPPTQNMTQPSTPPGMATPQTHGMATPPARPMVTPPASGMATPPTRGMATPPTRGMTTPQSQGSTPAPSAPANSGVMPGPKTAAPSTGTAGDRGAGKGAMPTTHTGAAGAGMGGMPTHTGAAGAGTGGGAAASHGNGASSRAGAGESESGETPGADKVAPGQDLVTIDFPEPTDIKDIIRAVAIWTGKNVILGKGVAGKVQMISPRRVTKEEAYQAFLSTLNVLNLTTVETGKVIKILPLRSAMKDNLQIYQGSGWAPQTDKLITQIVPLKYIDAKQVQATLARIVSSNSIIAYSPTNTLIVTDTGYKVRRILAIVELLDVQGQQPRLAIVPIRYADAKDVSNKVSDILRASGQVNKGSGSLAFKVSVDERSNSVIIFGPPRTIEEVKALVKKFDFPLDDPQNMAAIRVRFLDYADAKHLAGTLSSLAQGSSQGRSRSIGAPAMPPMPGAVHGDSAAAIADLGDNVKITADDYSNALLITGSRAAYQALNSLIRKLDRRRAQIYVEADILDVSLNNGFTFKSSILGGAGTTNGNKSIFGWQAGDVGTISTALSNTTATTSTQGMAAASALTKDFSVGILSGKTFNLPGIGTISPGALITLIKSDTNTRVLSSPHLTTANNEEAKIKVGDKLFYKTAVQSGVVGMGAIEKVEHEAIDLQLKVKPNVSYSGNYVTLKIDIDANEGAIIQGVPNVNTRMSSQTVTLKDGQTAVISGLIKDKEYEDFQKIPLLGDIPILGWLFRNSVLSRQTSSLMIFITPHIVYGANDLAKIYEQKVKERDEMMVSAFGAKKDDTFMKRLPTLEEGAYKSDDYDRMEESGQKKFIDEIRNDAGYGAEEAKQVQPAAADEKKEDKKATDEAKAAVEPEKAKGQEPATGREQEKPKTPEKGKIGPNGKKLEESITVPLDGPVDGEGGFGGGDMGGTSVPSAQPPPPPPPVMNEPVYSDGGDGGGFEPPPEPPQPPEPADVPSSD